MEGFHNKFLSLRFEFQMPSDLFVATLANLLTGFLLIQHNIDWQDPVSVANQLPRRKQQTGRDESSPILRSWSYKDFTLPFPPTFVKRSHLVQKLIVTSRLDILETEKSFLWEQNEPKTALASAPSDHRCLVLVHIIALTIVQVCQSFKALAVAFCFPSSSPGHSGCSPPTSTRTSSLPPPGWPARSLAWPSASWPPPSSSPPLPPPPWSWPWLPRGQSQFSRSSFLDHLAL